MKDRGHLLTELRNPRSMRIDAMSISEAFDLMNSEDARIPQAVAAAREGPILIVRVVEPKAEPRVATSGR